MLRLSERLRLRHSSESPVLRLANSHEPEREQATSTAQLSSRGELSRETAVGQLASEEHAVSRLLYGRLGPGEVAEAERLMRQTPEFRGWSAVSLPPAERRMLTLHCALWHRVAGAAETTGLRPHEPSEDTHAMARGALAAAGGLYEADLVADALASAGLQIAEIESALDFGCSSGRVVRVLAAAFPNVRWHGCDPNAQAIAWARENIAEVDFFVSGNEPPLRLEDAALELVFAISIWSHFEPGLGLRWFEEMRRVLVPGGHLVMTTHGLNSIAYYAANGLRLPEQCEEIAAALYGRGWWYAAEFGAKGDWGVVNPGWGTAFVSPEWVLANLCPEWRVVEFAPGRNAENQDIYVLQRV